MALDPLVEARFPDVARSAGLYESYYIRAVQPGGGLGFWVRYTVHKRPGEDPTGSVWFTLFDASMGRPAASKVTLPGPRPAGGDGVDVGESRLRLGEAVGSARTDRCDAAWELRFSSSEEPFLHLPRRWMYGGPLPRTKSLSPWPSASFDGQVVVDGREIAVDGWPGMLGHNWGAEHAERWIWLHAIDANGAGEATWLDAVIGRIKVGPLTLPWIANGCIALNGTRHRLGGPAAARRTEVRETPERCEFVLPGRDLTVQGEVSAARKDFVGWVYTDPAGGEHNAVNCSIADMRLAASRPGESQRFIEISGAAAYELGMRETDHGMEIQPFSDG
jgi:hypothetical protein